MTGVIERAVQPGATEGGAGYRPARGARPLGPRAGTAIVGLASAVVLVAEIVATRMIAPYVGVTLETISAVIGCILAGISIGNWAGGRVADSRAPRAALGGALVAGGVLLALAPVAIDLIGPRVAGTDPKAAVLLTMGAFFLPSVLLSMASPVVLKGLGHDPARLGRVAGNIAALATIGALVGNFGTGFFLVGTFRSDTILVVAGSAIAALGCALLVRTRRGTPLAVAAAAACAGAMLVIGASVDARLPCTTETKYVCLDIVQLPGTSEYLFRSDVYESSITDTEDSSNLRLSYARDLAGAVAGANGTPSRFLYVGAGGYTLPLYFADAYPSSTHVVLEIDPRLVEAVTDAIGLREHSDRISTRIGDARVSITELGSSRFDVIVADAFSGLSVPWHLTTIEFLAQVRARLAPDGLYVMNVVDSGDYRFARAAVRTLEVAFDDVVVLGRPAAFLAESGPNTNLVIVGGNDLPGADELAAIAATFGSTSLAISGADVRDFAGDSVVLSDQFAPVDQLLGSP